LIEVARRCAVAGRAGAARCRIDGGLERGNAVMLGFVVRRLIAIIPYAFALSLLIFLLIELPPGDYATVYAAQLSASGQTVDPQMIENLRVQLGLDQPILFRYWTWITNIIQGNFGYSFQWQQPVTVLIWERMGLTLVVTVATLLFTWVVAFPIGVYSAIRKYSVGDVLATFLGYIGLATPNFLLALILMYLGVVFFAQDVGGLFSAEYQNAPWSWAKFVDLLEHMWVPVIVIGTSGTASLIRIMRANLLDELNKPYVTTARAKGLSEFRLLLKYPVRIALNPFVSTVGWILPNLISGLVITAVVLNLPVAGPMLLQSLLSQDMYLAGGFLLLLCLLTMVGTLISDVLLAILDPRIRYGQ
jgi:peptide/nickel transport system permease protein